MCIVQQNISSLPSSHFHTKKILPYAIPHPFQTRQPFFQYWYLPLHLQERPSPPLFKKNQASTPAPLLIIDLSTMSKLLERLILPRIRPHITNSHNFSPLQSAYRPGFSTETALCHIFNNLSNIYGNRNCAVMVGLDLLAAFDTINHRILLDRLHSDFGIDGLALSWLRSYLSNRSQYVKLGDHTSPSAALLAGVPQGSVLGPLLFTTYTSPLSDIVKNFDVSFHQYADDTSLYSVLSNHSVPEQLDNLRKCTDAINDWHLVNFLQLNPQKSEVMFIGIPTHLKNLSPPSSINIAGIRHIRPFLSVDTTSALARSLVLSRLGYCNSLL